MEAVGVRETLDALASAPLLGSAVRPYAHARLQLRVAVEPETLSPAQSYVLGPGVRLAVELREALLPHGHDTFDLRGAVWFSLADRPGERIPVLPPIVEQSREADGQVHWLVADGMHRMYAARSMGLLVTVVQVTGVSAGHPYYAYPLDRGWDEVVLLEALTDGFLKKPYRQPENHKALFRDYNAVFPGMQARRPATAPRAAP